MPEKKTIAVVGATGAQGGDWCAPFSVTPKVPTVPAPSPATLIPKRTDSSPRSAPRSWLPIWMTKRASSAPSRALLPSALLA